MMVSGIGLEMKDKQAFDNVSLSTTLLTKPLASLLRSLA